MKMPFSTTLSKKAIAKLVKVKKESGLNYNIQIEKAILGGD